MSSDGLPECRFAMRRIATLMALTGVCAAVPQCGSTPPAGQSSSLSSSTTSTLSSSLSHPAPPPHAAPSPATVGPVTAAELGATWKPGCPVGAETLRRVEVNYLGFDGQTHRGELVVHQDVVADVIAIFGQLYELGYPIAKMRSVANYPGAEDELSMEDNNTSAFNCRLLPSGNDWALHAYGRAIDVNPLINPYIDSGGNIEPTTAGPYLDRNRTAPGMLRAGDPAVRAFTDRGWRWGGNWRSPKDYQHFERD
jgi:D-alanyl-D-alanine carboxypeptidase